LRAPGQITTLAVIHQTQPTIQLLLQSADYIGALDLIATTQEVLRTELHGLHCLRHMGSQLTEMQKVVVAMLEQAFNSIALEDFRAKLASMDQNAAQPPIEDKRAKLNPLISGLIRARKLDFLTTCVIAHCF